MVSFAEIPGKQPAPPDVWKDFNPDHGDFKEEIVKEETKDGINFRHSYISGYVAGEEIRVYCKYAVKAGATKAPGLKNHIGAKGYSYGGTIMWNLAMDSRVKAVVAYFGIGWIGHSSISLHA